MLKRLLSQIVVFSLALTLVTACSSAGKKDCKLLLEAKEVYLSSEFAIIDTFKKLEENQLVFQEPKIREYVLNYLDETKLLIAQVNEPDDIENLQVINKTFFNNIDIYCNSL